jgi:hypothetical protein
MGLRRILAHLEDFTMSLELWNTLATFGTFVVITATAIAALIQLRHMRGSNQISALSDLYAKRQAPEFVLASHFVFTGLPAKMQDPAFRYQIAHREARTAENAELIAHILIVGSFYEEMGLFVKAGLVDPDLVCDMHAPNIVAGWNALLEPLSVFRYDSPAWGENFEYLAVVAEDWAAKHRLGAYPAHTRRIDVPSTWRDADDRYATQRATGSR